MGSTIADSSIQEKDVNVDGENDLEDKNDVEKPQSAPQEEEEEVFVEKTSPATALTNTISYLQKKDVKVGEEKEEDVGKNKNDKPSTSTVNDTKEISVVSRSLPIYTVMESAETSDESSL